MQRVSDSSATSPGARPAPTTDPWSSKRPRTPAAIATPAVPWAVTGRPTPRRSGDHRHTRPNAKKQGNGRPSIIHDGHYHLDLRRMTLKSPFPFLAQVPMSRLYRACLPLTLEKAHTRSAFQSHVVRRFAIHLMQVRDHARPYKCTLNTVVLRSRQGVGLRARPRPSTRRPRLWPGPQIAALGPDALALLTCG